MAVTHTLELPDPSDWAATSVPLLEPLDSSLRCQVCKDYYTNAVITSCAHSFCSLCIRRCLAADGQCPACRTRDQEVKLRRNVALQEVVDTFVDARGQMLAVARAESERVKEEKSEHNSRGQKRKRTADADATHLDDRQTRRSTRQQARRVANADETHASPNGTVIAIDDSVDGDDDDDDEEEHPEPALDDGLVPCPMCGRRMKEEQVFTHLDDCNGEEERPIKGKRGTHQVPSQGQRGRQTTREATPERLPALNYALYKEQALKQKLRALGIPNTGSKPLMMRRHSEWINLWNANCDSANPLSRRVLLQELDKWERSQGGLSANGGVDNSAIMKKDFDGQAWATRNKSDFDDLIQKAREKRFKKPDGDTQSNKDVAQEDDTNATKVVQLDGTGDFEDGTARRQEEQQTQSVPNIEAGPLRNSMLAAEGDGVEPPVAPEIPAATISGID